MNGDALAQRIRTVLKDVTTVSDTAGFWRDEEIRLALNAAQDFLINTAIAGKNQKILSSLITQAALIQGPTLPANYLHYASAMVWDINNANWKTARVYIGGAGWAYMPVTHKALIIIGNTVIINSGAVFRQNPPQPFCLLNYYRRPSYIGLTSLGDATRTDFPRQDFQQDVYMDIAMYASQLLGMKEPQTQRDYKKWYSSLSQMALTPTWYQNYVWDDDKTVGKLIAAAMANSNNTREGGEA